MNVVEEEIAAEEQVEEQVEETGYQVLDDWVIYPSMLMGILVTTAFPLFLEQRICLPVLSAAVLIPMFVWALRLGRPRKAIQLGLFWAVAQSLTLIVASLLLSEHAAGAVLGGLEYRSEWLAWVANGADVLRPPAQALVQQARDLALFAAASLLTGGVGGLLLLTVALDAFNFTVASELQGAARPLLALLVAWPVWMIVRLAGYLAVGAVLGEPLAQFDLRPASLAAWWRRRRRLLAIGLGLIALALALQLLLTPLYRSLLQSAAGLR